MQSFDLKRRLFIGSTCGAGFGGLLLAGCSKSEQQSFSQSKRDSLTFNNTMTWDTRLKAIAESVEGRPALIDIPPPPRNSSAQVDAELTLLKKYQAMLRSSDKVDEINREAELPTAKFDSRPYSDYTSWEALSSLLEMVLQYIEYQIMRNKYVYNRVRPSELDASIKTVLPIPRHAAYPSGHSTQTHLIALVLGDVQPSKRNIYESDARRIAKNREIAGVHYPSDSFAGEYLALMAYGNLSSTHVYQDALVKCTQDEDGLKRLNLLQMTAK